MKLADGRCVFVEIPRRFVERDRAGSIALTPDGVRFLDRIRSLALDSDRAPSPAFLTTLREALGHTQAALARRLGVDKLTVSRWERGAMRPSRDSVRALFRLRREATRRGVVL